MVLLLLSLSALSFSTFTRDLSIVGYSPDDLTSMDKLIELFESWRAKHDKIYESIEEKLLRFEVFKDNLKHIDETNKRVSNYWLGLNEFADLSHEEFKNKYLGLKPDFLGTCEDKKEESEMVTINGYRDVPKNDELSLLKALADQPISVAIEASGRDFQF
ncbi:Cathepsin propeptide inhibitor domain (I29) [Dillenia turbinata]|uniref:Cathepsin propeptide inhibitor domain (I29) n=1 Tax=Dillenia turbinata TaxID=194707 RepID=A0AAN8VSA3_9MAGN